MFQDGKFRSTLRKPVSQKTTRELNKLQMTHGDALGLKRDEIMKFLMDANYRSRENTLEMLKKKNIQLSKEVSFCKCNYPIRMNSFMSASLDDVLCLLCGRPIFGEKVKMKIDREVSNAYTDRTATSFLPSVTSEPVEESRIPNRGKGRTLPLSDEYRRRQKKLPPVNSNPDPNRYKEAYLKALHVAKFGKKIPQSWSQFFNHEITPAFRFSYVTHTPRCLNTPQTCRHKKRDPAKVYTSQQIHRHIFKGVNVNDYLF